MSKISLVVQDEAATPLKGERGRGRPPAREIILGLKHQIDVLKKTNAGLRAHLADHFFALSELLPR
jgi:hypothetical protein